MLAHKWLFKLVIKDYEYKHKTNVNQQLLFCF